MADKIALNFKRGLQSNLPAIGTNGTFYLTEDTNRLYACVADNTAPKLLNQTVQIVLTVDALPATAMINDFYYCVEENILAVYIGAKQGWVQINPDTNTYIDEAKFEGGVNTEGTAIEYTLTLGYNEETKEPITASFSIDGTLLGTIVPSDISVGIDAAATNNGAKFNLIGTGADGSKAVNIMGGKDIQVSIDDTNNKNEISIKHAEYADNKTEAAEATQLKYGDEITITEDVTASNGHVTAITEKKYKLPAKPTLEELGGVSQDDFDDTIAKIANPMIYKGVVNSDAELIAKEANIEPGHTYMVGTAGTYDDKEAEKGDLFIWADGAWTYVPAGDDAHIDTQYTLQVHADGSINLVGSTNSSAPMSTIYLVSDTLKVEIADEHSVAINLEWGTF